MQAAPTLTPPSAGWNFDNSYARLPGVFFTNSLPTPVSQPRMAVFNRALAADLGLEAGYFEAATGPALLAGNTLPEGAAPIAQAYAGHQFGHFTMLGDGRAILLGEHVTPAGHRVDIQFKGSGPTPFSRRGDGRAALGPMLREYIISEAMHALGIPTTRSLAVVMTGEAVYRETALPGAILTRVASSHLRVGTFEYAAARGETEPLRTLADYTLARHYPAAANADNPYLALLLAVMENQAGLVAKWMQVGFIHGVMNTDNMAISGETIDYGPCAFMDAYHPATVFSSIDHQGRYAYANQPVIAQWNLARFAETLLPLLHRERHQAIQLAEEAIQGFPARYQHHWLSGMRAKLGLSTQEPEDSQLITQLLQLMQQHHADYTHTFRQLSPTAAPDEAWLADWHARWQERVQRQPGGHERAHTLMLASNPAVIPRNHRVEEALAAALEQGDFSAMHRLLDVLARPYQHPTEHPEFADPPAPPTRAYQTFCGT